MKRLILFSAPTEKVLSEIESKLFPPEIKEKTMAYIPADGQFNQEFYEMWKEICRKNNCEFIYINNVSLKPDREIEKLKRANIILVTGGRTGLMLKNMRESGIFDYIKNYLNSDNYIFAGFSAGAILLAPSANLINEPEFVQKENFINYENLSGIGKVSFEIFPHFSKSKENILERYKLKSPNEIRTISDDEYLIIEN